MREKPAHMTWIDWTLIIASAIMVLFAFLASGCSTLESRVVPRESAPRAVSAAIIEDHVQPATQQYIGPEIVWTNTAVHRVTVGWDLPTENVDGTPLVDLAGCRVYEGATSGVYTVVHPLVTATTNRPGTNTYSQQYTMVWTNVPLRYIAVTALDTAGNESDFSEELAWSNRTPNVSLNFTIERTEDLSEPWGPIGFFRLNVETEQ